LADETERTVLRRTVLGEAPGAEEVLHVLRVESPVEEPPRRVTLSEVPLRIGRVEGNDLVLAAPEISRAHCSLVVRDGVATVSDLGSTNGTFVDDRRVTAPTPLQDGARLRLGPFVLAYRRGQRRDLERAETLARDLERAARYQRALLPAPIAEGPVRASWRFIPSVALGGDGFGYRTLPDGRFAVWMLDATGHGIDSALLAVSAMTVLREGGPPGADAGDCAAAIAGLDAMFESERHDGLFFTLWYGVFDPRARALRHAAAGHHPAFLCVAGAAPLPVGTRNPPVGAGMFGVAPDAGEIAVPPGARLYLFSDGAFETVRPDGTRNALRDLLPALDALPDEEALLHAARALAGGAPFEDDVSILVLDL
jgi:sigma-B regulation protein RsbU (phosphoserine phosphatase)